MYIEKIKVLIDVIKDNKGEYYLDDLKTIEEVIDGCGDYIQSVVNMQSAIQVARFRMDTDQFQKYVETLDKSRSSHHNACISNIKMLNRLCTMYRCEKIFTDEEIMMDRYDIAEKIIKVIVDEYFKNRRR